MKMQNIQTEIFNGIFNSSQQDLISYVVNYKFFTVESIQSNNGVYEQTKATIVEGVKTNFGDNIKLQTFLDFAHSFTTLLSSDPLSVNFGFEKWSDFVSALKKVFKVEKIEDNEKMRGIKVKIFNNLFFQPDFKVIEAEYKILGQEIQSDLLDELNNLEFFDVLDGQSAAKIAWLAKLLPVSEIARQVGLLKDKKLTEEAAFNLFILLNHCYSITQEETAAIQELIVKFEAKINQLINVNDESLFLNLKIKQALLQENSSDFVRQNKQFLEKEYDQISCRYVLHCFDDINPFKTCTFEELTVLLIFLESLIKLEFLVSMHIDAARLNQDDKHHQAVKVLDKLKEYFTQEDYEEWTLTNFQSLCYALRAITTSIFDYQAFTTLNFIPFAETRFVPSARPNTNYQQIPFTLRYLNASYDLKRAINKVELKKSFNISFLSKIYQAYVYNTDHTGEYTAGRFCSLDEYKVTDRQSKAGYVCYDGLRQPEGEIFGGRLLCHLFTYHQSATWLANLIFTKDRGYFLITQELFDAIEEIAQKIISASNNLSAWANICHRLLDMALATPQLMQKINQTKGSLVKKIVPNYADVEANQFESYKPRQLHKDFEQLIKLVVEARDTQIKVKHLIELASLRDKSMKIIAATSETENDQALEELAFFLGDGAPLEKAFKQVIKFQDQIWDVKDITFDPNDSRNDTAIKIVAQSLHNFFNPKPIDLNGLACLIKDALVQPTHSELITIRDKMKALIDRIEAQQDAEETLLFTADVLPDSWQANFPRLRLKRSLKAWRNLLDHELKPVVRAIELITVSADAALELDGVEFSEDPALNNDLVEMVKRCYQHDNPKPFDVNAVIDYIGSGPKKHNGKLFDPYGAKKIAANTAMPSRIQALREYIDYVLEYIKKAIDDRIEENEVLVDICSRPQAPVRGRWDREDVNANWEKLFPGLTKPLTLKAWKTFIDHNLQPLIKAMDMAKQDTGELDPFDFKENTDERNDTLQCMVVAWRQRDLDVATKARTRAQRSIKFPFRNDPNFVQPGEEGAEQRLGYDNLDGLSLKSGRRGND